ncbi:DsbA family protein [Stackebrandtia nassauensis]|uniref:DSBA oxidoreductase n=1 Tax=Stackebrandtia nassauensis (strain DSM 44728 / CIP 108903 / NRRL B-16338 / NBRC 102104 / LLR-40K-21) TaxID=446470 RepID=D3PUA4_STANL|nr:thioredoxin domain-containing protein [Stackebrandtia nassauensis]ADD41050.1 DSBA oxidoreductase [Stackebrandtia nassauensis DSM 44728]
MTNPPPPGDPNQWGTPPPPMPPPVPVPAPAKNQHMWLYVVFGTVAALLIAGGVWVGVVLIGESRDKDDKSTAAEPQAEVADGGIVVGDGEPTVDIYLDFGCPACKKFQETNDSALESAIEDKKATIRFHPLNFLKSMFTDEYPGRAASASVCAADEDKFYDYYQVLMDNQPPEGGAGLDDDKLVELGADVGLGEKFADCVGEGSYRDWVDRETDKASDIAATPTVFIDGDEVQSEDFAAEFDKKTS